MTPQQNGFSERNNRTIMEIVENILKAKNMPNEVCEMLHVLLITS